MYSKVSPNSELELQPFAWSENEIEWKQISGTLNIVLEKGEPPNQLNENGDYILF